MAERMLFAVALGLIQAVIVWVASKALDTPRVWPGTILAFALGVLGVLAFWRGGR